MERDCLMSGQYRERSQWCSWRAFFPSSMAGFSFTLQIWGSHAFLCCLLTHRFIYLFCISLLNFFYNALLSYRNGYDDRLDN